MQLLSKGLGGTGGQVRSTWTVLHSPEGSFIFVFKKLRVGLLTLERRQGHRQQEGVPQRVHWLEYANVLDQGRIPQEAKQNSHDDDVNGHDDDIVQSLLLVTGLENVQHLFIRNTEKKFLIVR